jgi:capsule polysaccharide export protein KpsC/LpsZ
VHTMTSLVGFEGLLRGKTRRHLRAAVLRGLGFDRRSFPRRRDEHESLHSQSSSRRPCCATRVTTAGTRSASRTPNSSSASSAS